MFWVNSCHGCCGLFISLTTLLQVIGGINISGEVTPANPNLRVGENLTLTCSLINYFGLLNSSSLFFALGRDKTDFSLVSSQFYSVVSPTAIRLLIPFVNHTHQNFYRCYMNQTERIFVASTRVQIGSPPEVITKEDLHVVSRNLQDLNVTWCTKNIGQDLVKYNLSWTNIGQDLVKYNLSWTSTNWGVMESCPLELHIPGSQCYTCMWSGDFHIVTYHLVIGGSSIYGYTTSNFTINPTEHVKPDPVSGLEIEPLNSTSVRVKWNRPPNPTDLLRLNYTLTWMKKPLSPLMSVVVEEIEWIILDDLHPASSYTFGIRCIASSYTFGIRCIPTIGGYFSDETKFDFKTPDDIPAIAPESPVGWFHSPYCLDGASNFSCAQNSTCLNVTFYWLSIPDHLRNGEILGYHLQYKDPNGNQSIRVNSTSAQVGLVLHKNHVLRLSAFTSAGHSVMRSIVFQPNCYEMPKPTELFAEQTSDKRGVLIQWSRVDEASSYSLLYCRGKDRSCFGEPMLKVISPNQTNVTLPNVTEHIYALAVITERGTSGLSWINCVFDYDGPAVAPKVVTEERREGEMMALIVKWDPVTCNELLRSGVRLGRILNYTVNYGVTGADKERSVTIRGNITQVIIDGLSVGSNYSISVHGSTRTGPGQATKVFHLLHPGGSQGLTSEALSLIVVAVVAVVTLVIFVACYIRRRLRAYCWVPIKPPAECPQTSQSEYQENGNYTASVEGYAVVSKDHAHQFQGYQSGKESKEYEPSIQDTERTQLLDCNHNELSRFKAEDCSCQSEDSTITSTPMEELKGATDTEALLGNSSGTTDSVDPYDQSSEMGYASANMASTMVLLGPPCQPITYDSSFNDSSTSRSVGFEKGPVEQEFQEDREEVCDAERVVKPESTSAVSMKTDSMKTDEDSASGGYSKASYAIQ